MGNRLIDLRGARFVLTQVKVTLTQFEEIMMCSQRWKTNILETKWLCNFANFDNSRLGMGIIG